MENVIKSRRAIPPILGLALALVIIVGLGTVGMRSAMSQPGLPTPTPEPTEVSSERYGGASRFETAVLISQAAWPDGAVDVFLARADEFADALAGSSLVSTGPILLVPSCGEIPQVVLDEINRLQPNRVVALGGVSAVCDQVVSDSVDAAEAPAPSESPSPTPT